MMGFTPEGDELPLPNQSSTAKSSNETSAVLDLAPCEWKEEKFTSLPKSVQRYFHRAFLFTGENEQIWEECIKIIQSVTCLEEGEVLSNGIWLPFQATRHFSATPLHAGFVWDAKIKYPTTFELPYDIPYYVRETYANGGHDRTIKIFGALPIVHNVNKSQEDEQAGFRWLAFSPIFPTSLLPRESLGVQWSEKKLQILNNKKKGIQSVVSWPFEKKSDSSVVLAEYINPKGISSKALVHFDSHGLIDSISAVGGGGDGWQFHLSDYKNVGYGLLIPTNIQSGREEYGRFVSHMNIRIQDVKYTFL
jgi:hypothetical protein